MTTTYKPLEAAQKLGIGRNTLLRWMRENGLTTALNVPTRTARAEGLLIIHHGKYDHPTRGEIETTQPRITKRGLKFLRGRLTEAGLISPAETAKN